MSPQDNDLAACDALVSEVLMAWRFSPEGEEMTGATLLRWRQLTAKEQAYYRALVAPCVDDRHARVRVLVDTLDDGRISCRYSPPHPERCGCGRPVFVSDSGSAHLASHTFRRGHNRRGWPARAHGAQ